MNVAWTAPLFDWDALEDSPSLKTVRQLMASVPDEALLASLRQHRGHGRGEYPVHVLWGVCVLTVALRHPTTEACLAELRRNPSLRRLIGIESEEGVPKKWNMSRFLSVLGEPAQRSLLEQMFGQMVRRLSAAVVDLGEQTAGDSTGLSARVGRAKARRRRCEVLPEPTGGRKEYTNDEGEVVRVIEWFGYKLHLLVDTRHEVVLSWQVTGAHAADNEQLPSLLAAAQSYLPKDRIRSLAYDKAADDGDVHALLDDSHIRAIIENRSLWKQEHERMLPGATGRSNIVYDEAGTVYCYDKDSDPPVRHRMAYIGHEPARRTLKYRCPAMHEHWHCPSHARCNSGRTYGLTVRVPRDIDLRRFPAIPRATKTFQRLYRGRTAVERVNARLKIFWGADDGNITGARRFHATIATIMIVHLAFATLLAANPTRKGTLGKMNLTPIAKALREQLNK